MLIIFFFFLQSIFCKAPFHLCIHLLIYFPYLELQSLHPLSHRFVLWGGGVGQLELEQVVASWCVAVLVEHDGGAGAACGGEGG